MTTTINILKEKQNDINLAYRAYKTIVECARNNVKPLLISHIQALLIQTNYDGFEWNQYTPICEDGDMSIGEFRVDDIILVKGKNHIYTMPDEFAEITEYLYENSDFMKDIFGQTRVCITQTTSDDTQYITY